MSNTEDRIKEVETVLNELISDRDKMLSKLNTSLVEKGKEIGELKKDKTKWGEYLSKKTKELRTSLKKKDEEIGRLEKAVGEWQKQYDEMTGTRNNVITRQQDEISRLDFEYKLLTESANGTFEIHKQEFFEIEKLKSEIARLEKSGDMLKEENKKLHRMLEGVERYRDCTGEQKVIILSATQYKEMAESGDMLKELEKLIRSGYNVLITLGGEIVLQSRDNEYRGKTISEAIASASKKGEKE